MRKSKVYLVGAGPGRPDLITVRGLNILKQADVIIYDYLVDTQILKYAKADAELLCCDKLAKKGRYSSNSLIIHQKKITDLIIKKVRQGKRVIRLKNGDPSIFSRTTEELEELIKANIEFEIIPGVTAATAAACLHGIPLTDRTLASTCIFVTGQQAKIKEKNMLDWNSIAKADTAVLYMAVGNLADVVKQLLKAGKSLNTPVAIIQNASLINQKIVLGTLKDIVAKAKKNKISSPSVVIIGDVVKLETKFNWTKRNKKVLFTGLSKERFFLRESYFHLPLINIKPLEDYSNFDMCLRRMASFDWIIFASRYGVEYFFNRLINIGFDSRAISGIKIAAIGNSTRQRLLDFGIIADVVPKEESSQGLLKRLRNENIKDKSIFLPRSDISDKGLENGLKALGAYVTSTFAYKNVMPDDLPQIDLNSFDEINFTSPSTVRNFKRFYKRIPRAIKIRCIGKPTQLQVKRCRLWV